MMRDKQKTIRELGRWIVIMFLGAAIALTIPIDGEALTLDEVIAGAKKEGQVRVGVSVRKKRRGVVMAPRLIEAFQKRYPFVKVKYKRIGGFRVRERVFSEMVGGVVNFDVATLSTRQVADGIKANLFRKVDWKSLGVRTEAIQPKNFGVTWRAPTFGIGYNTEFLKKEIGQRLTWQDCVDPKWKGKFGILDRPRHLEVLYQDNAWGREKTLAYAKRLAANNPSIERGNSEAHLKLSAGAYPFLCGARWNFINLFTTWGSENVAIAFPEPVLIGSTDSVFVPRAAKSPNAAILWIVWSLSDEGQKILDKVQFTGDPMSPASSVYSVIKDKKKFRTSWKYQAQADANLREILTAMGFPVVR